MHIRRISVAIAAIVALAACAPEGVMQVGGAYEAPVGEGLAVGYATFDGAPCHGTVHLDAVPQGASGPVFRLEAASGDEGVTLKPRRMPAGRYRVTRVACRADAFAAKASSRYAGPAIESFTVRAGHIARVGVIEVLSPAPLSRDARKRMGLKAIAAHTRAATHRLRPFERHELRGI